MGKFSNPTTFGVFCLIAFLNGCQLPPDAGGAANDANKARQLAADYSQKARDLEGQGDLSEAALYWQIVASVQPNSLEARDNFSRLEDKIRTELAYYVHAARTENARGNQAEAVTYLLNALAVAPDDPEVIRMLQQAKRAEALMNFPQLPKKIKSRDSDNANVDEIFELGLLLISTNKSEARKLFESILEIDPDHLAARAYLELLSE